MPEGIQLRTDARGEGKKQGREHPSTGCGFDGQEHFNYRARMVSGGTVAGADARPW